MIAEENINASIGDKLWALVLSDSDLFAGVRRQVMNDDNGSFQNPNEDEYIRYMRSLRRALSIATALLVLAAAIYFALK